MEMGGEISKICNRQPPYYSIPKSKRLHKGKQVKIKAKTTFFIRLFQARKSAIPDSFHLNLLAEMV